MKFYLSSITAKPADSLSFSSEFFKKSNDRADGWNLLSQIFGMHEKFDVSGEPFGPMIERDGRRSFIPEDLTDEQMDWLRILENGLNHPEICARLADLSWLREKDHNAAVRAVSYYMAAGLALEDPENWPLSIGRYTRAYRLATQLGRKSQIRDNLLDFLLGRLRTIKGDDPRWWSLKIMNLLYEARHGDHSELAKYARIAAERAENEHDFRRKRDYLEFVAKLHHRDHNKSAAEDIHVEI